MTLARSVLERPAVRYGFALAAVALAFGLRRLLEPATGTGAPFVLFFGAILASGLLMGVGPAIVAAALGIPLGASLVMRGGFAPGEVASQSALFAIDAVLVVYLSFVTVRARDVARRAAQRGHELLDLAPDAALVTSPASEVIDVNEAACRLLGYERVELIGKPLRELLPDELQLRLDADRAALSSTRQVIKREWSMRRRDGTLVPVEVSATVLPDRRGQAFIRDITERKRVEDERRVHVALLDSSSELIAIAGMDGRLIYVNPAGRAMLGLPDGFAVEQTCIADYFLDLDRAVVDTIAKRLPVEEHLHADITLRHWQTGATIPFAANHFVIRDLTGSRVLGRGVIAHDISDARRSASEHEQLLASERLARQRAEAVSEELRESEERFRLMFDDAPIGMVFVALDGRYVRVNSAMCRIVGYSAEELQHMRFQDITPPDDLERDLTQARRLASGEVPFLQTEQRYVRKDGRIVTTLVGASVLRDRSGRPRYFIGEVVDITERKGADEALARSQARLSGIIEISDDAIISIDHAQRITLFNHGAERIFGYAAAEVVGAPVEMLLPPRFHASHRTQVAGFAIASTMSRRMGERGAVVGRRKTGEEFPAEASISKLMVGGKLTLTVALRDVTDRRRIERDLQFLAEAGATMISLDPWQTVEQLAGLACQELAECCVIDVRGAPDDWRRVVRCGATAARFATRLEAEPRPLAIVTRVVAMRRPILLEHAHLDSADLDAAELRPFRELDARSLIALPLQTRGELFGVMVLISSPTGRGLGTRELRLAESVAGRAALAIENGRLYERAIEATRERDQLLGVVAHDLRNPLNVARMQLETLRVMHPELEQKPLDTIQRSTDRMNHLIQDLLDVMRLESGELRIERARVATRQLLADAVEAQQVLAERASIDLRLAPTGDLPDMECDAQRVSQVLENLIGNALKFTPPGGVVTVGVMPRDDDVQIWVADSGPGIAPEQLPHVFERFWQANKATRTGAGLGLPIARGLVEAHGGRIWVESTLGHGTTVHVTIPQARGAGSRLAKDLTAVAERWHR